MGFAYCFNLQGKRSEVAGVDVGLPWRDASFRLQRNSAVPE
jgi:hypothetical protein